MAAERAREDGTESERIRTPLVDRAAGEAIGSESRLRPGYAHSAKSLLWLQRQVGNLVAARAVSPTRDAAAPDGVVQRDDAAPAPVDLAQIDCPKSVTLPLSVPPAIEVASELGAGDLAPSGPLPDDATVMTLREGAAFVQRDDTPHPSGDVSQQTTFPLVNTSLAVPCSISATLIYRNINVWSNGKIDFGHEPSAQFTIDLSGAVAAQSAITLMNVHWKPFWDKELETGLSGFIQTQLYPALSTSFGTQAQAEQHLTPWFSVTLSTTGAYLAPREDKPGSLSLTGSLGALVHLDALIP